ncbi:MAG: hypothetical protein IKO55_02770, partial [Kiritimatiellae bacterium]|nr:hypothetical protein [Kiritimatiellia bacterium]
LAGPLTAAQIRALSASAEAERAGDIPQTIPAGAMPDPFSTMPSPFDVADVESAATPVAPFAEPVATAPCAGGDAFASVRVHFVDAKSAIDTWTSRSLRAKVGPGGSPDWFAAEFSTEPAPADAASGGSYIDPKARTQWAKEIAAHVYQDLTLDLWRDPEMKLVSKFGEAEGEFRIRAAQIRREKRDAAVAKVEADYQLKLQRLDDKIRTADDRVTREKNMAKQKLASTSIWAAITAISIFGGGGKGLGGIGRIGSTARGASAYGKKRGDVAIAENSLEVLQGRRKELEAEFAEKLAEVGKSMAPDEIELERVSIRPRKTDITVETIVKC